jgi:hypothetical protein
MPPMMSRINISPCAMCVSEMIRSLPQRSHTARACSAATRLAAALWRPIEADAVLVIAGRGVRPHAPGMFVVSEAEAAAIRTPFDRGGELSAVVELRRLSPSITEMAEARECARTIAGWTPLPVPLRRVIPSALKLDSPGKRGVNAKPSWPGLTRPSLQPQCRYGWSGQARP